MWYEKSLKAVIDQLEYDKAMCEFNPMTGETRPMNEENRRSAQALDIALGFLKGVSVPDEVFGTTIYFPMEHRYLSIDKGTGDNLLPEDIQNGYVDYLVYEIRDEHWYDLEGGRILLEEPFEKLYPIERTEQMIGDVLNFIMKDQNPSVSIKNPYVLVHQAERPNRYLKQREIPDLRSGKRRKN